ncbi:MAG: DUF2254 domain-containing protein [Actinobacteria bacterium]|nr:DUF2254 domain-containing protein [Actinomycetota bacterium]
MTPPSPADMAVRRLAGALIPRALAALVAGWVAAAVTLVADAATGVAIPVPTSNAQAILAALAGALLTIAVFAVWMRTVVVGLAAAYVSPRVVSNYLDDRFQRRMTTAMIAGFAYVLAVLAFLPAATGDGDGRGVPAISSIVATLVVVVALLAVLLAIRHAVSSLSPSALVRALADGALATMAVPDRPDDDVPIGRHAEDGDGFRVRSDVMGWVQDVDYHALLDALPPETTLTLPVPTGEFVARDEAVAVVDRPLPERACDAIRAAVTVAPTRSGERDLAFAVQQLVDVAQHAMTTTSNDTSTADEALVHLRAVLGELLRNGKFSGRLRGADGRVVVSDGIWDPADHVDAALERLAPQAAELPTTRHRLLLTIEALESTAREVGDERSRRILAHHHELLVGDATTGAR